jgi:hypothetical protein
MCSRDRLPLFTLMDKDGKKLIYVYLLDEPVDAWRPVLAVDRGNGLYQIARENSMPADEAWEFVPGDVVRVRETRCGDNRTEFVAVERVDSLSWEA